MNPARRRSLGGLDTRRPITEARINGFEPTSQQTFTVFEGSGITGAFSNVANGQRLTTIDGLGSFLIHYGPQSAFDPNQIILTGFELSGCSS
jgi:hypothetical protein